jgi:hypothetical protein
MLCAGKRGAHAGGAGLSILILGNGHERNRKRGCKAKYSPKQGLPSDKISGKITVPTITCLRGSQFPFAVPHLAQWRLLWRQCSWKLVRQMQKSLPELPVHIAAVLLALSCMSLRAQNPAATPAAPVAPQQPASAASLNDALLAKATALYASTAKSGLHSFDCSVHPDWEKIMTSSRTGAPAAGGDSEIALLNNVKITLHAQLEGDATVDWVVPAGKPLDPAASAMLDRAHRGIEQTLTGALKLWIPLVNGSVAESLGAEDVDIRQTENGYSLRSKDKRHSLTEEFDRNLLLTRYVMADSGSAVDISPRFQSTSQGLLLSSFTALVKSTGESVQSSQEMHISVEYQAVAGAQIPAKLAVDVPNVVAMDFALDGCTVNSPLK